MKRIALHTLGCKLNYAETAALGKQFIAHGYTVVSIHEPAEVVVINSCSVTLESDRECRQVVRRALRYSPDAFVAVIGCSAQLHAAQIAEIHGVDLILGSQDKFSLLQYIEGQTKNIHPKIVVSCLDDNNFGLASSAGFENRTRAFLKVQDGCDYQCTYCTIPLARGRSRSTTIIVILQQAREAIDLGYKEIVLTGVNVGDYGKKEGNTLLTLLKQLVMVEGLIRIRISSVEPNLLTDELLDFWMAEEKLCNHWHIPLQSGSNTVLRKMQRRYLTALYTDRVEKIKSRIPTAGIGTDVIVGFPGESDELFEETYNYLNDLPVSYIHVFRYSERPNTHAAEFTQKIDPLIKTERSRKLRQLSNRKRLLFHENFINTTVPVLIESAQQDGTLSGLTEEYVRVDVKSESLKPNTIIQVTVSEASSDTCIGEIAIPTLPPAIRIAI